MERYIRLFVCFILVVFGYINTAFAQSFELPMIGGTELYVTQGNNGTFSHQGTLAYAWDWTFYSDDICRHPALSPVDGTVVEIYDSCNEGDDCPGYNSTSCGSGFGNHAIIDYDTGYRMLAHLHEIYVSEGEWVMQGQVIGLVGSTGYSTEAHIHDQSQYTASIGSQSFSTTYYTTEASATVPTKGEEVTSTNSAVFDDRLTTELMETNPYSNSSIFLGTEDGDIHWWNGTTYGTDDWDPYDPVDSIDPASNDYYAETVYVQDYKDGWCDGAIVYDALGGARSAYTKSSRSYPHLYRFPQFAILESQFKNIEASNL